VWAIAISGWVVAVAVLWWTKRGKPETQTEAQLQHTMREYVAARSLWHDEKTKIKKGHEAQIDAIRASVVQFELEADAASPDAVKQLVDDILNKTKLRGERG
jgi:hypothetical protein